MTPLCAALATATAVCAFWLVTRRAARVRRVDPGGFPFGVLAAAGVVAAAAASLDPLAPDRIIALAACAAAAVVDRRTGLVVDPLNRAFAGTAFAVAAVTGGGAQALLGAALAGGLLLGLHLVTARRGLGLGDVKLAAGIGAALGPSDALAALAAAFVLGGIHAASLLLSRRAAPGHHVRFAPFLAAGVGVAVLKAAAR